MPTPRDLIHDVPMKLLQACGSLKEHVAGHYFDRIRAIDVLPCLRYAESLANPERNPKNTQVHLWPARIDKEDVPAYRVVWRGGLIPDALDAVLEAIRMVSEHYSAANPGTPPATMTKQLGDAADQLRTAMQTVLGRQPQ